MRDITWKLIPHTWLMHVKTWHHISKGSTFYPGAMHTLISTRYILYECAWKSVKPQVYTTCSSTTFCYIASLYVTLKFAHPYMYIVVFAISCSSLWIMCIGACLEYNGRCGRTFDLDHSPLHNGVCYVTSDNKKLQKCCSNVSRILKTRFMFF